MSELRDARARLARALDARNRFLLTGGDQASRDHKGLLVEIRAAQQRVSRLTLYAERARGRAL